ncbi:MAG: MoaD/ThiS family protein [Parafilimonas sp.]
MQVNVIVFGQLIDITGCSTITLNDVSDINELTQKLYLLYPALVNIKYAIAVDKQIINENIFLENNNTVALLPPFSGG